MDRTLITQVSRFDPWKDPMGVIEVYQNVRKEMPGVQLALLGQMALELGATGREHIKNNFLITRLLADELKLLAALD